MQRLFGGIARSARNNCPRAFSVDSDHKDYSNWLHLCKIVGIASVVAIVETKLLHMYDPFYVEYNRKLQKLIDDMETTIAQTDETIRRSEEHLRQADEFLRECANRRMP